MKNRGYFEARPRHRCARFGLRLSPKSWQWRERRTPLSIFPTRSWPEFSPVESLLSKPVSESESPPLFESFVRPLSRAFAHPLKRLLKALEPRDQRKRD